MAVEIGRFPAAFDCESCDCIDGIAPVDKWHTPGHIEPTRTCYRYAVRPISSLLISLFPHFEKGTLYTHGGIGDQPAVYIDAMEFLSEYLRDNEN